MCREKPIWGKLRDRWEMKGREAGEELDDTQTGNRTKKQESKTDRRDSKLSSKSSTDLTQSSSAGLL